MKAERAEVVLFRFTARMEKEAGQVYYTCIEAPVVGCGKNEQEAYADLFNALTLYVRQLEDRGELDRALELGMIPSIRVDATSTWNVDFGKMPLQPVPEHGAGWLLPAGMAQFAKHGGGVLAGV